MKQLCLLTLSLFTLGLAQTEPLTVAVKDAPPFVIPQGDGSFTGISIDLWELLAEDLDLEYSFVEYDLPGLLAAVEAGEVDAGIAAITVTRERESVLDFSHPYFETGLSIAVSQNQGGLLAGVQSIFSQELLLAVLSLAALLLVIGLLIYLLERKANPEEFGGGLLRGVGEGFWWAAVTMTTVGYGDRSPKTHGGRVLGLIWMFSSLIILGGFIAAFTAALTFQVGSRVETLDDLRGLNVGVLAVSATEAFLETERIDSSPYDTVEAALEAVDAGELDAVVHDDGILQYLVNEQFAGQLEILPRLYDRQFYAAALPPESELRESLNRDLIALLRSPEWQEVLTRYLGEQ